jgi:hypothetical protein
MTQEALAADLEQRFPVLLWAMKEGAIPEALDNLEMVAKWASARTLAQVAEWLSEWLRDYNAGAYRRQHEILAKVAEWRALAEVKE